MTMAANMQKLEDLYPLSDMQAGLLFETLLNAEGRAYVTQHSSVFQNLDPPAFQRALQQVVKRHAVLRTAFIWKTSSRPLQAVLTHVDVPFEERDWSHLSPELQAQHTAAYLQEDRATGFDLARAPLMRVAAMRLNGHSHRVFVTHHHALLDGWSLPLLFGEIAAFYRMERDGVRSQPAPVRPFRDYIAWLQHREPAQGEHYWSRKLSGFKGPTPLGVPVARNTAQPLSMTETNRPLSPACSKRIRTCLQRRGLTLHTLCCAAWALALGTVADKDDVAFGAIVSGRPPELDGVESMLGLFINTLPCRIRLRASEPVDSWLTTLQTELSEMRQYQHNSLSEVRRWAGVASGHELFTTLVDSLNYPSQPANECGQAFQPNEGIYSNSNPYPLQLVTQDLGLIILRAVYDPGRLDSRTAGRMLRLTRWAIASMVRQPAMPLGRVMRILKEASRAYTRLHRRLEPPVRATLHPSHPSQVRRPGTYAERTL
jgi:hypothetical protein